MVNVGGSGGVGLEPHHLPGKPVALGEDVVDLVSGMQEVEAALVVEASYAVQARTTVWPGTAVCELADGFGLPDALGALAAIGADEATLVAADAPDLPPLLLGKLHSALTTAEVAVCPADGGGLVALAARLPVAAWLGEADAGRSVLSDLGGSEILSTLRRVAPRRMLHVGAGWHRVRGRADLARLDPGLEGWEVTRALLGG